MADLKHDNSCTICEYYDMEANDYYYEWCRHPDVESCLGEDDNPYSDYDLYVIKCPITGKSPYEEE